MDGKPTYGELEERIEELENALTVHKAATDAVKESAVYLDIMGGALIVLDSEARVVKVNEIFTRIWGYSPQEVYGKSVFGLFPEAELPKHKSELANAAQLGGVRAFEATALTKDRRQVAVSVSGRALRDEKGNLLNFVALYRDTTEHRKAEEELKRSEDFNRALFRHNPIQTIAVDRKGKIVEYNMRKEKSGDRIPDIGSVMYKDYASRHKEDMYAAMMDVMERKEVKEFPALEYGEKCLSITIAPYPYGAIITTLDITESRAMAEKLGVAEKMEAIGTLAGGIAHDYNNLLAIILGNIDLIGLSLPPESEIESNLSDAKKACLRAKDLTNKLITFSEGGAPVKRVNHIAGLLKESAEAALRGSNVNCEFIMAEGLWATEYDEVQMKHVINNLIFNSVEAMPHGGTIRVTAENVSLSTAASRASQLSSGRYLKISVQDPGTGIAPRNLPRIFDPYFSTKDRGSQKGLGLGLATVKSIIHKHNGEITVDSKEGIGSTFHVYLPVVETETVEAREEREYAEPRLEVRRVLLMDDEEMIRELARQMLARLGYSPVTARDGSEAVELYREAMGSDRPFDVAILDLTVKGGMGGQDAIKALLEMDPDVRAIVASGYSNDAVITSFEEYGFMDALAKPYTMEDLSNALDRITAQDSQAEENLAQ